MTPLMTRDLMSPDICRFPRMVPCRLPQMERATCLRLNNHASSPLSKGIAERVRAAEREIQGGVIEWRREELLQSIQAARASQLSLERLLDNLLLSPRTDATPRARGRRDDDDDDDVVDGFL